MQLDDTDVQILRVLQMNGRLSYRQIAERVKVSVPTVSSKIAALERSGVIRGYAANLDPERLGGQSVMITVRARPADLRTVAERLAEDEQVRGAFLLSNCRVLLSCTFTEPRLVNEFVDRMGQISEITEYEVGNVVAIVRDDARALLRTGSATASECAHCHETYQGEGLRVRLDSRDYQVCSGACARAIQDKYLRMRSLV